MTAPRRDPRGSIARVTAVSGRYAPSEAGMSVAIGDVRPLLALLAGDGVFAAGLSWQDDAPCGQADGDAWFPEKGELSRSAKMICRSCPARLDCLRYALDRNEEYGVWGGLSWEERRNAARARKRGASLEQVAADADAAWDAVMAAAADHAREIGRMGAELALADRDQSGEVAA